MGSTVQKRHIPGRKDAIRGSLRQGEIEHEFPLQFYVKDGDKLPNLNVAYSEELGECIGWRLPDGTMLPPYGGDYYPQGDITLTAVYGEPGMITFYLHNTDPLNHPMFFNGEETDLAEITVRTEYRLVDALHSYQGSMLSGEFVGWTLTEGSTDLVSEEGQLFTQDMRQ